MVFADVRVVLAAQRKSWQYKCAIPNTIQYYILSTAMFMLQCTTAFH